MKMKKRLLIKWIKAGVSNCLIIGDYLNPNYSLKRLKYTLKAEKRLCHSDGIRINSSKLEKRIDKILKG